MEKIISFLNSEEHFTYEFLNKTLMEMCAIARDEEVIIPDIVLINFKQRMDYMKSLPFPMYHMAGNTNSAQEDYIHFYGKKIFFKYTNSNIKSFNEFYNTSLRKY